MATRMLYRHPGKHAIHGDFFDYIIADQANVAALIKDGWWMTTTQALENSNLDATQTDSKKNDTPETDSNQTDSKKNDTPETDSKKKA